MSQQSDTADAIYERLTDGSFPLARLVRELRGKWGPDHRFPEVHRFAEEVSTLLLRYDDVEIGDQKEGTFVSWAIESWDAHQRIDRGMMSMDAFLEDETQYVFRKK